MAKQTLPTNFKDDVLNTSMSGKRKWNISQNSDGTYSITDVTTYDQVGSEFGAGELNATNQAVNASADAGKIIDDPDTAGATTEEGYIAGVQLFNHVTDSLGGVSQFIVDEETGKISGYKTQIGGADTVFPFIASQSANGTFNSSDFVDLGFKPDAIFVMYSGGNHTEGGDNYLEIGTYDATNNIDFSISASAAFFRGANRFTVNDSGFSYSPIRHGGNYYYTAVKLSD